MDRKTDFECSDDVERYFAVEVELWKEPKPEAPDHLLENLEQARLKRSVGEWYAELLDVALPGLRYG